MGIQPAIKPLTVKAQKVVVKVQHDETLAPKFKIRAHCVCIFIAVILTATVPNYLHSNCLAAFTVAGPNFLQEVIDRIFHL